jgi:hypothetical protein
MYGSLLAPTNITAGKTVMTPADANLGWQYFMNHEYIRKHTEYCCSILPGSIPGCHLYFRKEGGE